MSSGLSIFLVIYIIGTVTAAGGHQGDRNRQDSEGSSSFRSRSRQRNDHSQRHTRKDSHERHHRERFYDSDGTPYDDSYSLEGNDYGSAHDGLSPGRSDSDRRDPSLERNLSTRQITPSIEVDNMNPVVTTLQRDIDLRESTGSSMTPQTVPATQTDQVHLPPDYETELEAEVLQIFGDRLTAERVLAPAIHKDVAVRWEEIVNNGLPLEEKKALLKKYPPPINCTVIDPPKLNLEVKAAVDSTILKRDDRIVEKQEKIAAALASIGNLLTLTLKIKSSDKIAQLESLNGAARLLADLQHDETAIRRSLILKNMKASFRDNLKESNSDEWLFGKDLAERIKAAKVLYQSTRDLKAVNKSQPETDKTPKNFKSPARQRQFKPYSNVRGGGQRQNQSQSHRDRPAYRSRNQYPKQDPRRTKKYN